MMTAHGQIDPNTGRAYELCPDCDCPMLPPGVEKRPNEYDHASGCPREVLVVHRVFEMSHIRRGRLATSPTFFVTDETGARWRFLRRRDAKAFVDAGGKCRAPDHHERYGCICKGYQVGRAWPSAPNMCDPGSKP